VCERNGEAENRGNGESVNRIHKVGANLFAQHGRLKPALHCAPHSHLRFAVSPLPRFSYLTFARFTPTVRFKKVWELRLSKPVLKKNTTKKEEYMSGKITSLFIHILALGLILVGAVIGYFVFIPIGIALELVFWILLFTLILFLGP
jgi:hypothetical protein